MPNTLSLQDLFDNLNRSIEEITSSQQMKDIGEALAEIIRVRTRLGYGVKERSGQRPSKRERLKPLSAAWKAHRAQFPRLSGFTRPNRSNLTYTGQMLESLTVVGSKSGEARIEPTGTRPEGLKNLDLARYVAERGRPFLDLSDNEERQFVRLVDRGLNESLRRRLGR